jgi:hypothetical protein
VITDAQHEDLKDALRALNARLVELDDRVPDNVAEARDSLTGAWRAYNRLARVVDPTMVWPVDEDDLTGRPSRR